MSEKEKEQKTHILMYGEKGEVECQIDGFMTTDDANEFRRLIGENDGYLHAMLLFLPFEMCRHMFSA